jgi:hypothetical protein
MGIWCQRRRWLTVVKGAATTTGSGAIGMQVLYLWQHGAWTPLPQRVSHCVTHSDREAHRRAPRGMFSRFKNKPKNRFPHGENI